jgi:hypothetical protein
MRREEEKNSALLENRKGGAHARFLPHPRLFSPPSQRLPRAVTLARAGDRRILAGRCAPAAVAGRFYRAVKGGAEVDIVVWIRLAIATVGTGS